jgi:hypothetical protein
MNAEPRKRVVDIDAHVRVGAWLTGTWKARDPIYNHRVDGLAARGVP